MNEWSTLLSFKNLNTALTLSSNHKYTTTLFLYAVRVKLAKIKYFFSKFEIALNPVEHERSNSKRATTPNEIFAVRALLDAPIECCFVYRDENVIGSIRSRDSAFSGKYENARATEEECK